MVKVHFYIQPNSSCKDFVRILHFFHLSTFNGSQFRQEDRAFRYTNETYKKCSTEYNRMKVLMMFRKCIYQFTDNQGYGTNLCRIFQGWLGKRRFLEAWVSIVHFTLIYFRLCEEHSFSKVTLNSVRKRTQKIKWN